MDKEVRDDIPIPAAIGLHGTMAKLRLLKKAGDSVVVAIKQTRLGSLMREIDLTGKYTSRTQPDGSLRVWRTKD